MLLRGAIKSLFDVADDAITSETGTDVNRRTFLKYSAATAGVLATAPAFALNKERCLSIYSPNTGETIRLVYWTPSEGYLSESIQEISLTMRDRHNDKVKLIDPKLLDQMYALQSMVRPRQPMHMLSGYRSPETNAMLRRRSKGVAKESYHMKGMAVDIRMPDRDYTSLHRAALSLHAGGVGRYRRSRFLHIDTGPVRTWG